MTKPQATAVRKPPRAATKTPVPAVTVRRTIEATPEELFDAWLEPHSVAEWMRPNGIVRTVARIDARIGGRYEIVMHLGSEPLLHHGIYQEIDRPRRLVFTWASPATRDADSLVTVDFQPRGRGKTEVVITHERLPATELSSHTAGWTQALERLAALAAPQR